MVIGKIAADGAAVLALGAVLAAAPVGFDFGGLTGSGCSLGKAFAKDGRDDDGGGGGGGERRRRRRSRRQRRRRRRRRRRQRRRQRR